MSDERRESSDPQAMSDERRESSDPQVMRTERRESGDRQAMSDERREISDPKAMSDERREISDPKAMRAFAHPTRLALLELIGREGEITASRAAAMLDESPGNMSWHLQTLAKYGFVEEAEGGKGRSRPWRVSSLRNRFVSPPGDEGAAMAGDEVASQILERAMHQQREWFARRRSYSQEWQDAAFQSASLEYLTVEELAGISNEIVEIFARHSDRFDKRKRPEGALPVRLTAFAHPLPPTEAGN